MSDRAERLVALLAERGLDALLVTNLVDVRYLTGYTGSNGAAVIGPDARVFLTDFRYVEQAASEVDPAFDRRQVVQELLDGVSEVLAPGELRLGFDDADLSVSRHAELSAALPARVELIAAGGLVERLRAVKEPAEIAAIAASQELADASFAWLMEQPWIGRTERELALALEDDMRRRGAERPSFDSIVAGGAHGALPHAHPRVQPIRAGELVVVDWGAELDGYCSDCTRTVAAGAVDEEAESVYATVLRAQRAGVEAVRAGAGGRETHELVARVIEDAGHGEHFGHGLGHGVGLEVHEAPRLSRRSTDELVAGNVVTVEPGIYLPGRLGVRIEDLVVVTEDGCRVLTSVPKELRTVT